MFQIVLFIYNDNSLNMKLRICTLIAVSCAALSGTAQNEKLTEYVNPLVGTDGYGNVYPGAQIPFGGIQISPDTDAKYYDAAAGYKYNHTSILGFSLTHLSGTGIPDLGDFLFIPGTGEIKLEPGSRENPDEGYRSRYTHDEEQATPNYYAVRLQDYGVKAEMTAGVRSGMFRFTYPESEKSFIMIDMNHTLWQSCEWANLRMENDSTITGYKLVKGWGPERHVYFAAVFSRKLTGLRFMQDKKPVIYNTSRFRSDREAWGKNLMACLSFATGEGEEVIVKTAISSVSTSGAKMNMQELDGLTFDSFTVELPDDIPGAHDIQGRIGGYWHGNEPCHHIAYLYNYLGKPWKCQKWIREIVARFYGNEPGSLSGNDDCGQMSAWYMFNCAGFYPVAPSSNIYNIGSPCVEALSIRMSNGKEIKMTTENWSEENVYIKELYVNGKKYDKSYLTYEDVQAGITLHFVMSGKPNYKRAVSVDARPASLSSPGKTMFYQISDSK